MNNFCRGNKYTETKINLKRLHRCWREGDNSGKKRKMKARRRTNLPIPSTEAVFINWNRKQLEVHEEIPTGQITHWKIFHQNLHVPS